jgi:hypothetical protein
MLRRILGPTKLAPQRPPGRWLVLPEGHEIDVVGESFHQKELHTVEQALSAAGANKQTAAVLFREPTNQYDRNAVAVAVVVPGRSDALQVGYLSRGLAPVFGRQLKRVEKLGYGGAGCVATLEGAWGPGKVSSGPVGVVVNIASKRQVQKYLTALAKNPNLEPDGFADDPESDVYEEESDWEEPGWIEETDS